MAKVKHFDNEKNLWVDHRPNRDQPLNSGLLSTGIWKVVNTDMKDVPLGLDSFYELLQSTLPTVVIVHNASPFLPKIKSNKLVRKGYSIVEPRNAAEDSSVGLVHAGLSIDVSDRDSKGVKLSFTLENSKGSSVLVVVASPSDAIVQTRRTIDSLFSKSVEAEATVFSCFTGHGSVYKDGNIRDLLKANGAAEASPDRNDGSWALWVRSSRCDVQTSSSKQGELKFSTAMITTRSSSQVVGEGVSGVGRSKGKGGTPLLTDPAVLSAEVSAKSQSSPSELLLQLKKNTQLNARWNIDQAFQLRQQDGKLTNHESVFDISRSCASLSEAIEMLIQKEWPMDYAVVHQTVLYSSAVAASGGADRQSFRRYAKDHHRTLTAHLTQVSKTTASSAQVVAGSWQQRGAEHRKVNPALDTPREWSEASSIIIYQTTPREMKFNISSQVQYSKNVLQQTIKYLNKDPSIAQENNPLLHYNYDYALLHSPEHNGFWLIAATHVPCDIVACRMVV